MSEVIVDGPDGAAATFLFAHGAGAPMDHPWMDTVAGGLAAAGIRVVRFEFPYMAGRRVDGKRRGPDRPAVLEGEWREAVERFHDYVSEQTLATELSLEADGATDQFRHLAQLGGEPVRIGIARQDQQVPAG